MNRPVRSILICLAAFIAQAFLSALLPAAWTAPNILFCAAAGAMMLADDRGRLPMIVSALAFQLFWDASFGLFTGIGFLSTLAVLLLLAADKYFLNIRDVLIYVLTIPVITFVFVSVYWLLAKTQGGAYPYADAAVFALKQMVYNLIILGIARAVRSSRETTARKRNWYV